MFWEQALGFEIPDDVPEIPEAPSQRDGFEDRPRCQEQFKATWPAMTYDQPADDQYRRLYYHLHALVDRAIGRILDALETSGMAEDTIVVFTSDHGDLLGSHGGLMQKWYNAFDEAIRVPLTISGPGIDADPDGVSIPTSHVDLLPTLLGLAGIDVEQAAAGVAENHIETQPLPGRDLSGLLTGTDREADVLAPVYFMTDDDVTRGMTQQNVITGEAYEAVGQPSRVESVITHLPTGEDGTDELWKLNHYYERLDDWDVAHDLPTNPFAGPAADAFFEVHNLTVDPEERRNRASEEPDVLHRLRIVLEEERDDKRLLPRHRNP
jgi:arylsulfatase A-like enzyme